MSLSDAEVRERVTAMAERLARVEGLPETAREVAVEALESLVELRGEDLERLLAHDGAGGDLRAATRDDELLDHLLILHGLHPDGVAERVRRALTALASRLAAHGGAVDLLAVEDSTVRLELKGGCSCGSSAEALRRSVEEAIRAAAPEIVLIDVQGAGSRPPGFVPLWTLRRKAVRA